jgi:hypothetical protein
VQYFCVESRAKALCPCLDHCLPYFTSTYPFNGCDVTGHGTVLSSAAVMSHAANPRECRQGYEQRDARPKVGDCSSVVLLTILLIGRVRSARR